jgi:hypothetical protein
MAQHTIIQVGGEHKSRVPFPAASPLLSMTNHEAGEAIPLPSMVIQIQSPGKRVVVSQLSRPCSSFRFPNPSVETLLRSWPYSYSGRGPVPPPRSPIQVCYSDPPPPLSHAHRRSPSPTAPPPPPLSLRVLVAATVALRRISKRWDTLP